MNYQPDLIFDTSILTEIENQQPILVRYSKMIPFYTKTIGFQFLN